MKKVIILAGPPGSGKTYHRENELADVPGIDIADIYAEHQEKFPGYPIDWQMAHAKLRKKLRQLLDEHDKVWVEAMFRRGSPSLRTLLTDLKVAGVTWEFRRMETSLADCFARVAEQYQSGEVSAAKTRKRNEILRSMAWVSRSKSKP